MRYFSSLIANEISNFDNLLFNQLKQIKTKSSKKYIYIYIYNFRIGVVSLFGCFYEKSSELGKLFDRLMQ
jgi:hypothetical protein